MKNKIVFAASLIAILCMSTVKSEAHGRWHRGWCRPVVRVCAPAVVYYPPVVRVCEPRVYAPVVYARPRYYGHRCEAPRCYRRW